MWPGLGGHIQMWQTYRTESRTIVSIADEPSSRVLQMRAKAQELEQAAERATDPQDRQRLREKARRLKEQSEQERGMTREDIDPM